LIRRWEPAYLNEVIGAKLGCNFRLSNWGLLKQLTKWTEDEMTSW